MTAPEPAEVAALRQRVADLERRELVAQAQRIAPGVELPEGVTASEIHARVVAHLYGPAEVDGASEDTLKGYYRALVHLASADPARTAARTPAPDLRH